jgi:radical SAM-linked protein
VKYGSSFPVRLRYTKRGRVRWISHRDVARAFERAFRIESLPLAFSQGFSPRPRVSFGLALPTGYESDDEYLDVSFAAPLDPDRIMPGLTAALPEGLDVAAAAVLVEGAPALQEAVTSVEWELAVADADGRPVDASAWRDAVAAVLARDEVIVARTRKGRTSDGDVRGAIRDLAVLDRDGATVVHLVAATVPQSVKPVEALAAIAQVAPAPGPITSIAEPRVLRTRQWIERDGARHSPLDADTRPRVPEARAS